MKQKQERLREEREIGATATAPRMVLWQRSINSSSNLSRKSHSSASANRDSETEADMDTKQSNKHRDHVLLDSGYLCELNLL